MTSNAHRAGRYSGQAIMLSINGVCSRLGVGRSTFYKLVASGAIRTCKVGGQTRVHLDDFDAYVASIRGAA